MASTGTSDGVALPRIAGLVERPMLIRRSVEPVGPAEVVRPAPGGQPDAQPASRHRSEHRGRVVAVRVGDASQTYRFTLEVVARAGESPPAARPAMDRGADACAYARRSTAIARERTQRVPRGAHSLRPDRRRSPRRARRPATSPRRGAVPSWRSGGRGPRVPDPRPCAGPAHRHGVATTSAGAWISARWSRSHQNEQPDRPGRPSARTASPALRAP